MAPSSFSSHSLTKTSLHHSSNSTPIQECEREKEEDGCSEGIRRNQSGAPPSGTKAVAAEENHRASPLPSHRHKNGRPETESASGEDFSVNCNKCRPSVREKFSVVPLDNGVHKNSFAMASPNGIFKSIVSTLSRKSPKSLDKSENTSSGEEQMKIAFTELSNKLIQATMKKDEAILEASTLKSAMAVLEKKLNKLEIYCHSLKTETKPNQHSGGNNKIIEHFLVSVSESRSSVRFLSRSLTMQLRHMGIKVYESISALLLPFDAKLSLSKNPRSLVFFLEALLNRAFYEDFEPVGFQKSSANQILNPNDRVEANFASFTILHGLTWEEVLSKGTKHFSDEFSRFCDRKMSEIVAMLGWNRAWSEPLLQAFFGAAKAVWSVHLLANSVHPSLPIFRVDKDSSFDPIYMEDMGGDRAKKLAPSVVRAMVAPGFYVHDNVVKSKVLCRYYNENLS